MSSKGKNKRRQLEIYDTIHNTNLSVDSQEEVDFINWCCEAVNLSVIVDFKYQPDSFKLFDDVKYVDVNNKSRSLFRAHQYSPDFMLYLSPSADVKLLQEFKISQDQLSTTQLSIYIDTKGTFNKNARSFNTDRKWVWQKFKIYICEVIPQKFFKLFGVPEKSRLTTKTKKPRSCYLGFQSLIEIFKK